jgi:hypothetical protein
MAATTAGPAGFALVLALATSARAAPARTAERLVAVVLVSGASGDAELAERVKGQTSDLELALVVEQRAPGATGPGPSLGEAAAIAAPSGARVVIWFERNASSWLVHIAEPGEDREFVRRVAARGDLASSATAEGVALVVRGALRALAAGGTIGVAEPPGAPRSWRRGFAAIGWRGVTYGGPTMHHGVSASAGLAAGRWRGDLSTGFYPAVELGRESATIRLERWSFAAGLGVDLGSVAEGAGWRAGLAIEAGTTRFERVTTSVSEPLLATPPETTWSPTASARARLARRIAGRAWLELAVGSEFVLRVPEFGVDSGSSFDVQTRLHPVEPFGALGLVIDLG